MFQIIVGAWLNVVGAGIKLLSAFPDVVPSNTQLTVAFIGLFFYCFC